MKAVTRRTTTGQAITLVASEGMKTEILTPPAWLEPVAAYRNWLKASGRPNTTIYLRIYHLRRFAAQTGLSPFEVTLDDLLDHLSNPNWGPSARRATRSSLRKFYSWAHVTGRILSDPSGLLPPIQVPPGKPRPASAAAVHAGLTATDSRVPLMVELGDRAGMRCCEIAVVHTRDLAGEPGRRKLLVHGKGGRQRFVDISEQLALRILEQDGYAFPGRIDGHLSAGYVSKLISWAMGEHGTAHPLRHRAGTRVLRNSGGNLRIAQEFLGHASVATTQIYTAVDDESVRNAVLAA
jgi:site-specific recombinase XerD